MANSKTIRPTNNMSNRTTTTMKSTYVDHDRIAKRAYQIWLERNQPYGQDMEHWLQAERELKNKK